MIEERAWLFAIGGSVAVAPEVHVGQQPIVRIVGQMELPDRRGSIAMPAEVAQPVGQQGGSVVARGGAAEAEIAVVMTVLAGKHRDAAGGADRVLAVGIAESHACRREVVQIWRQGLWMAFVAGAGSLMLVGDDVEDIHHRKLDASNCALKARFASASEATSVQRGNRAAKHGVEVPTMPTFRSGIPYV